jgi:plasmid replication initiation protein
MKTTKLKVFQSNKFTESRQEFNLNEKRIMQFIIAKIKPTDTEFRQYIIPIAEIANMANIKPNNMYTFGKTLMISMLGKFILLEDKENKQIKGFNYFHHLDYADGKLTVQLHEYVHHLFLELKKDKVNFTAYELTEFMMLTSTYAQRIYELIKQYSMSKNRERIIEISELRNMLAIEDKKYKLFSNFRKRVLELSHKLIEENTNLRYKWKTITERGRKVHAIHFYEIHIAGKESPTKLQEKSFLESYIGKEIYNNEINSFIIIKNIENNKDGSYYIQSKYDEVYYTYKNLATIQECIAKTLL